MAHDHLDKPESRIQRCVAMSDRHQHRQQHPRLVRAVVEQLARFMGRNGHRIEGVQLGFLALALGFGDQGQGALQHRTT